MKSNENISLPKEEDIDNLNSLLDMHHNRVVFFKSLANIEIKVNLK